MEFGIERDHLLEPLQKVVGVIDNKQTLPILSHVLFRIQPGKLDLVGTDTEIELRANCALTTMETGEVSIPARKLFEICRNLPSGAYLEFSCEPKKVLIKAGSSRFNLLTLPVSDFPRSDDIPNEHEFIIKDRVLHYIMDKVSFAMAQQDVRYYLNGVLLQIEGEQIRLVATDGHRLAAAQHACETGDANVQAIIPRKAILELARLLKDSDDELILGLSRSAVTINSPHFRLNSKLIESRYPDYRRVIPSGCDKCAKIDREALKQALVRVSVLATEKKRGVRLHVCPGKMTITANNPEQEMGVDELDIEYEGQDWVLGFKVDYLLDVINCMEDDVVRFVFSDEKSSLLIESDMSAHCTYVVMPLRL